MGNVFASIGNAFNGAFSGLTFIYQSLEWLGTNGYWFWPTLAAALVALVALWIWCFCFGSRSCLYCCDPTKDKRKRLRFDDAEQPVRLGLRRKPALSSSSDKKRRGGGIAVPDDVSAPILSSSSAAPSVFKKPSKLQRAKTLVRSSLKRDKSRKTLGRDSQPLLPV